MELEEQVMGIIINAGQSRSLCYEALHAAKAGDFATADAKMQEAAHYSREAHLVQTQLIEADEGEGKTKMTLVMVHAQDHLMTSILAKELIAELEPFDRELFGGIVGWCDDEGNGEWVVTIRCARLQQRTLRLFAGAGIVPASSPLGEWRETGVKLTTMLNVFGLN
mgnify:FL=1